MTNDTKLESFECKAYAFDADRFCSKAFKDDEEKCHSTFKPCCEDALKICPPTPLHMYLIFSSIGCLLFLGLIGAVVFWKKRKGKKAGTVGPPGTPGTLGTTRTTGTTGTRTKQTETQAAADYYFGES